MSDAKNTKKATAKAKGDSKPNESATPSDTNKTQAAQIPQPGSESEQKGSADPEQENGNTDNTGQNGGEIASLATQNQSGSAATKGADSESGENDLNNQDDDLSSIHDEQSANAKRLLEPYRANLDSNKRIENDYGLQRSFKWKDGEFKTRKGVAFRAVGADQSPRGTRNDAARPDVILIDDIDTDQDCRNPNIIANRVGWIYGALIPTRSISVPLLVLVCGNIIAEYCCVTELMKKADKNDIINVRTNGKSSWAKNTEAHIDRIIRTMPYSYVQQEYFNNPVTEGRVFKKLNWSKVPPLRELEQLIVYADPSPSNADVKNNSYKVVALLGRDRQGVTYVIKVFCEQTTNAKFVQWFYDIYELTRGLQVYYYIENNSLQNPFYEQVFIPLFRDIGRDKGYIVPIRPDTRKKPEKFTRIEGTLEPANRLGLLVFNEREKDNQQMQTVVEQFGVVSPTYKGAMDAPDCIEGGYKILDEKLAQRQGTYRVQRRASRRY